MSYEENLERIEDWRKAGNIASQALNYGCGLIKKDASFLEVLDLIEKKIYELGGEPAFPAQMSMDHVAAHDCADPDDDRIFDEQLVCLDVGVHVNGAIGDNAATVDLSGKHEKLVEASREALNNAAKKLEIGVTLGEIGKTIQDTIEKYGFKPIHNLSGHGLDYFQVHTHPQIPNFDNKSEIALEKGMVIAIEPFATDGAGMIYEMDKANIFAFSHSKPVRSQSSRLILNEIKKYNGLPFTTRWLTKKLPAFKVNFALRELLNLGVIKKYPPLPDRNKGFVSQAENTFLINDEVEVLTKI